MDTHSHNHGNGRSATVGRLVFAGFVLVAGYFLLTEHRAHLFGVLPYLLLAACPLMHLFHHGHHHHHDDGGGSATTQTKPDTEPDSPRHPGH